MANKLITIPTVTVSTAGTRQQITATETRAITVAITALETNVGTLYVGDSNVSATRGIPVLPGAVIVLDAGEEKVASSDLILSDIYVDVETSGDKASIAYIGRR